MSFFISCQNLSEGKVTPCGKIQTTGIEQGKEQGGIPLPV